MATQPYPLFLSVVCVVRNLAQNLEQILGEATEAVGALATDYEIIVVDNGSDDASVAVLKELTAEGGLTNLQVFALTKEVDRDTASWVGLENALGDFVALFDPMTDDIAFLPQMLDPAATGADVVFASNLHRSDRSLSYRLAFVAFNWIFKWLHGVDMSSEAPHFRILSRRVVNFILQHPQPALTLRHLPASGGFAKANLSYEAKPRAARPTHLADSVDRGMRLLVSTTRAPLRLVTSLSLLGAIANVLYSFYVVAIALFKTNVEPGWTSLSLQQSGMFFLISLVLLVLGEYILNMASLANEGPLYHVAQEFTSARLLRREKLNIEEHVDTAAGRRGSSSRGTGR